MAYFENLAAEQGIRLWNVIVALLLSVYAYYSFREGESENGIVSLGAAIFSLLISWGTDYYKAVWIGGALIVLSIVMLITPASEGILPRLMMFTGGALLASAVLLYIFPATTFNSFTGFMFACIFLALVVIIDTTIGKFDEWWQVAAIFSIPVIAAVLLINSFGVDHAWYGLVMMYFGVILGLFGLYAYIVDPIFFGGLMIFADDFIGEAMQGKDIANLWFFLALVAGIIYIIYKYKEDWL